jgi:cytochrome P450
VLPYGDLWRRKRKLMHSHIHQGVVDRYHPLQIASARRLAREILVATQNEDILPQAIRLNFSQIIIKAVYGLDVDSYESDYVSLPEKWLEISAQITTPGQFLVDVLPVREWPAP